MRVCFSTECPGVITHAFAISHYINLKKGNDEFSKKLLDFYFNGNNADFFMQGLVDIYKLVFEKDKIRFDIITLIPGHESGSANQMMKLLAERFSAAVGIPYEQVLFRNRTVKQNHEINNVKGRYENMKDSIDVTKNVKGKNIILMDNTIISGMSAVYITKILKERGAGNVVCLSLGFSDTEKEKDYWLDGKMLVSTLMSKFKGSKISKSEREEYKKSKGV